ncbi:MAG: hypothetical protein ACRDZW_03410, partial [Acidimicrobiales bacterium]
MGARRMPSWVLAGLPVAVAVVVAVVVVAGSGGQRADSRPSGRPQDQRPLPEAPKASQRSGAGPADANAP